MKSVQLNFFIHPEDLKMIESYFVNIGILFISQPILDPLHPYSDSIQYQKTINQFKSVCILQDSFLSEVIFRKIPKQRYYLVDVTSSYVLEFSRGGFSLDGKKLERARLYFTKSGEDESGSEVAKTQEFTNWAEGIIKVFKKKFLRRLDNGGDYWYSDRIIDWISDANAKLDTSGLSLIVS